MLSLRYNDSTPSTTKDAAWQQHQEDISVSMETTGQPSLSDISAGEIHLFVMLNTFLALCP